jgi:hypothetical protein
MPRRFAVVIRHAAKMASVGSSVRVCGRSDAGVVSPVQSPGASGPSEIWRRVAITVTSGQYFACSSANSR